MSDNNSTATLHCEGDGKGHMHMDMDEEFYNLTMLLLFLLATWVVGKAAMWVKVPSLLGELVVGMVLGPELLDVVPFPMALTLVGEVGLLLLVLEAGLEVDLQMLKQIGKKGFIVAAVGSLLPLGMGTGIAIGIGKMETMEALSVGASLAPTSMAIALNILKVGKSLHSPAGQLIIAAAVIDDVIALILLSELKALQNAPTAMNFITPILSSTVFTLAFGGFAIFGIPRVMEAERMKKFSDSQTFVYSCFFGMFVLSIGLMNATYYGKSSFLLGAFLAGLCFCTIEKIKVVWHAQVKRIETWMLRLFFSTTIAFKVPVRDLWRKNVLAFTAALLLPLLGKLVTGFFGPRPLKKIEFFTIGFAMSAWGEFAFVVANTSLALEIMSPDTFASVVLAVLISAIISPWALSLTLLFARKQKELLQYQVQMSVRKRRGMLNHAYLEVDICCVNRWGLIDGLINKFHALDLSVLDFTVSSLETFSIMRLYLKNKSKDMASQSEVAYFAHLHEEISKYCGITSGGDCESDFGFLPDSPIPSAVFKREDVSFEGIELYPCLSIKPWKLREGSQEGQSVAEMQQRLDNFTSRVNSARKLDELARVQRNKSLADMQASIIKSAQS
ncbi:sodium/hydrogen exchanger protein [Chloropicon primus]|uniref:Sodium/hydrogen exchanger protein n=1 Tax=Chloropicon primus TaxID=1764295 RepID=A0A5B8MWD5_9CHLO|nr:sodium/hydrogen exchanger protein [Chloropicon primus]UPR04069.1 sodium/hydrogen exchanger protein [Chloropicon primus]|eukprot:QDZ24859.1 sodium/hydrogen exchanger protein [Chloropicon primus]